MKRNEVIVWVDILAGTVGSHPPASLEEAFQVQKVRGDQQLAESVRAIRPVGIFYDCDYPDAKSLRLIGDIKKVFRSIPFVLITLQHSESLAVWAFRQGALDYFVKPVQVDELGNCIKRLDRIAEFSGSQQGRKLFSAAIDIPASVARSNQLAEDKLAPAIYYVRQNYDQRIYSAVVARLCGLSTTYFSKAFAKRFNMSFQEFILQYRVAKACILLENPKISISDASYSVGFRDPSYFTRVFKRYVGSSPSEFLSLSEREKVSRNLLAHIGDDSSSTSSSQVVRTLAQQFAS
jgi:AraC-like DNA-binding protein